MDSITVARWDSLTSKEQVKAIERNFLFDEDPEWDTYSWEEKEKILLDNTFIEWRIIHG